MDGLEEFVMKKKIGYIRIDGSVNVDARHERVQSFQNDDDITIAIVNIDSILLANSMSTIFSLSHY